MKKENAFIPGFLQFSLKASLKISAKDGWRRWSAWWNTHQHRKAGAGGVVIIPEKGRRAIYQKKSGIINQKYSISKYAQAYLKSRKTTKFII